MKLIRTTTGVAALALLMFAAWFGATALLTGCGRDHGAEANAGGAKYFCPMHPTYVSDRPGDCPICNMKLVPMQGAAAVSGEGAPPSLPGRVTVQITPEKRQLIGVRISEVQERELRDTLRTTGVVVHDETRLTRIAPRFGGWVRKLHVNFTGQPVQKGDPLFTVYSPELLATENEYLLALRNAARIAEAGSETQSQSARRLVEAARRRLELLGVGDAEIQALEERGTASEELLYRSPAFGHVVMKNAVAGKAFTAGDTLYEIADLSHLWVRAFVFEYQLLRIAVGQKAFVHFPNLGNETYESEVTFVYPHLDPQTRRAEIRLELDNPHHRLRPEMWANVELVLDVVEDLAIPASAVIDTGARFVVFVEGEDHHLEPREVKVGVRTDDYWQVTEGLKAGEKVVTRALFLVDSESQLKAAIAGMAAAGENPQ